MQACKLPDHSRAVTALSSPALREERQMLSALCFRLSSCGREGRDQNQLLPGWSYRQTSRRQGRLELSLPRQDRALPKHTETTRRQRSVSLSDLWFEFHQWPRATVEGRLSSLEKRMLGLPWFRDHQA